MKQNFRIRPLDAAAEIAKSASSPDEAALARAESLEIEPIAPEVSVVMPCLNESLTLGTCIQKAFAPI